MEFQIFPISFTTREHKFYMTARTAWEKNALSSFNPLLSFMNQRWGGKLGKRSQKDENYAELIMSCGNLVHPQRAHSPSEMMRLLFNNFNFCSALLFLIQLTELAGIDDGTQNKKFHIKILLFPIKLGLSLASLFSLRGFLLLFFYLRKTFFNFFRLITSSLYFVRETLFLFLFSRLWKILSDYFFARTFSDFVHSSFNNETSAHFRSLFFSCSGVCSVFEITVSSTEWMIIGEEVECGEGKK